MRYEYMHPCDELALTLDRIYNYKMTTTSGGNLSIKDMSNMTSIKTKGADPDLSGPTPSSLQRDRVLRRPRRRALRLRLS